MKEKPGSWSLGAIDARSRWEEHEAAVATATRRWGWLLYAIQDSPEQMTRRVEYARKGLGMEFCSVDGWGDA